MSDAGGAPLSVDADGAPLPVDAGGAPLPVDAGGPPLPFDAGGSPLPFDAGGASFDAKGVPLLALPEERPCPLRGEDTATETSGGPATEASTWVEAKSLL